jgi:hypothetical protein
MESNAPKLTLGDATRVLHHAREFYKSSLRLKSANKVYRLPEAQMAEKHRRRNLHAYWSQHALDEIRGVERSSSEDWLYQRGEALYGANLTAGNCEEMCAVVMRFCKQLLSNKCKAVYAIGVDPGDHVFVLLSADGSAPPVDDEWGRIDEMKDNRDNFWIVDCWFNIVCAVSHYSISVARKLQKWAQESKRIISSPGATEYNLNQPYYLNRMKMGYLTIDSTLRL